MAAQAATLGRLLRRARHTRFGSLHGFGAIDSVAGFQRRVALRDHQAFWRDWWQADFPRLRDATWPGAIPAFANSSGTTQGATKRIPVSRDMQRADRLAALDVLAWHLAARPDSRILGRDSVFLGGSTQLERLAPGVVAGDLSGLAAARTPVWARGRALPSGELARLADWREKMERLAPIALSRRIGSISGTTSWLLLFLEIAGAQAGGITTLAELFPALELVVHGGVGFAPYAARFAPWTRASHPSLLREVYAASEGFIAVADRFPGEGLRLLLDRGLFFEFVRPAELADPAAPRRWIADAEIGEDYALVLSSNAGLWSYVLGDTVRLLSRRPARLLVTGRTAWSLSVAGEHLVGGELEAGLQAAARAVGRALREWSAAPFPPDAADGRAGHLFAVELDGPAEAGAFAQALDRALALGNADYAAHRGGDFGLRPPAVRLLPPGSFESWMQRHGRLGAQNKVPRVVASADRLDDLRPFDEFRRPVDTSARERPGV